MTIHFSYNDASRMITKQSAKVIPAQPTGYSLGETETDYPPSYLVGRYYLTDGTIAYVAPGDASQLELNKALLAAYGQSDLWKAELVTLGNLVGQRGIDTLHAGEQGGLKDVYLSTTLTNAQKITILRAWPKGAADVPNVQVFKESVYQAQAAPPYKISWVAADGTLLTLAVAAATNLGELDATYRSSDLSYMTGEMPEEDNDD